MNQLPPELQPFANLLEAQPGPVQVVFQYCLCLLMVEAGKMRLVETRSSESEAICVFETTAGDSFKIIKPLISKEIEADLMAELREMIGQEGYNRQV